MLNYMFYLTQGGNPESLRYLLNALHLTDAAL